MKRKTFGALGLAILGGVTQEDSGLGDRIEHCFAESDGVQIHYVRMGTGPLVVLIHGFPDYWYTWRYQMAALAEDFTVVAMDQRGYNRSDAPEGLDSYRMPNLIGDVVAVVRDNGAESATIVGHDWGAAVAWQLAMHVPDLCERLVILSVPHPSGFTRELTSNTEQRQDSQYARDFQRPDSHESLTAEGLASWVRDEDARARYVEAFGRSDFDGMLNYYKQNYPDLWDPDAEGGALAPADPPSLEIPTLIFHGLQDQALHSDGLNNTWDWIDRDLTIVTAPDAGHFVQQDAAELVTETMLWWLLMRR